MIELSQEEYEFLKDLKWVNGGRGNCKTIQQNVINAIKHGTPITDDCISRDATRNALFSAFGCENATKYGNKNAKQQELSYSTMMMYEIASVIESVIDNVPTQETKNIKHWSRCLRCGKTLKNSKAQERGYGEVCWKKHLKDNQQTLF